MTQRGGLTFLFTDIEGSTHLVDQLGSSYGLVLRIHRRVVGSCVEACGGREFGTEGDAVFYAFSDPGRALEAAVAAQRRIESYAWPDGVRLRVRMGLATGKVAVSGGEYVGLPVHEAARICAAAHGGQILCSAATVAALDGPPADGELLELGTFELRGIPTPRPLLQLTADGLEHDFPPPRDTARAGGSRVSIWRRAGDDGGTASAGELRFRPVADGVETEVRRASGGEGTFRLVIRRHGAIEEEFDGLTTVNAASVVNAHSGLVRVED